VGVESPGRTPDSTDRRHECSMTGRRGVESEVRYRVSMSPT
jgi:hypothetical protein